MSRRITRRRAVGLAGATAAGVWLGRAATAAQPVSPNQRLNLAFVGCGGRGQANLQALEGENIVALCDVDQRRAAAAFEKYPRAAKFHDFRRMFDRMHREIDAVVVSAPNHIHAPASAAGLRLGKHCYCEKPLSHSVYESRVLATLAAERKLATQMGTQIHAGDNYRRAIEILNSGAIGPVGEVDIWTTDAETVGERPRETPPVPAGLHWDLWLGPAPERPYHPCYLPRQWHFRWDFGGGVLGNVGCHYMDLAFWALKLRHPSGVEAEGPPIHPETTPQTLTLRYQFPARGDLPPVRLTWYQGRKTPRVQSEGVPDWDYGFLFVGQRGMLLVDYSRRMLLPQKQFADYRPPKPDIPNSPGHWNQWVAACKNGTPTGCNFDDAGALTEAVLLGNVAYRAGRRIEWDGPNLRIPNCPDAERFLRRDYRTGWTL
jgi:predicted dehydrogenase